MAAKFVVRELKVRRENGDVDVLYLCDDCATTTGDFLKILKRRRYDTSCDRCGDSADSRALKIRMERGY